MSIFTPKHELMVITRGPGNLRLLSWADSSAFTATVGGIPTDKSGITRYVVSFSHNYTHYAFIWDGAGEAVYQIGDGLERKPVGRVWTSASTVNWGDKTVTNGNVTNVVPLAANRDNETTAYVIRDLF